MPKRDMRQRLSAETFDTLIAAVALLLKEVEIPVAAETLRDLADSIEAELTRVETPPPSGSCALH